VAGPGFDPLTLPIAEVSADPPLGPAEIDAPALVRAFQSGKAWQTEPIVEPRSTSRAGEPVVAAVLIGLVQHAEGLSVLLTQRTAHLHDHAGQISFPGGRAEPEDADAAATALRETEEEIGVDGSFIEVLGQLPVYLTGTGFSVTPVVALIRAGFTPSPDPFEVAEVFEVPLSYLMDPRNHQTRRASIAEVTRAFYTMPYGNYFIWGATAGMLRNLYRFLAAQRS
jgi:8-oxo-dGTP pyrophosphatase MutT (NUDIX family)